MKVSIQMFILFIAILLSGVVAAQVPMDFDFDTPYGSNESVGKYAEINGCKMYYEEYGKGEPMFLIHGNGGDIKSMGHQIEYFKSKYRVIIADSRGHGKSELNTDSLTYVMMAKDWNDLADYLGVDSLYIIGWSDGGILGLLLGINHPDKVKKMVTMGANLRPDSSAVYSYAVNFLKQMRPMVEAQIKSKDTTQNWGLIKQQLGLLADQPTIAKEDLSKNSAPTLVVAGDQDIIREEHSVEIFQHLPKAQLCILPGNTHYAPATTPLLFNTIAEKFLAEPFSRPDSDWTKQQ